jgi:hypothetical protein
MVEESDGALRIACACDERTCDTWMEITPEGMLAVEDKEGERVSILLSEWLAQAIRAAVLTHSPSHQGNVS